LNEPFEVFIFSRLKKMKMRKLLLAVIALTILSCAKNEKVEVKAN